MQQPAVDDDAAADARARKNADHVLAVLDLAEAPFPVGAHVDVVVQHHRHAIALFEQLDQREILPAEIRGVDDDARLRVQRPRRTHAHTLDDRVPGIVQRAVNDLEQPLLRLLPGLDRLLAIRSQRFEAVVVDVYQCLRAADIDAHHNVVFMKQFAHGRALLLRWLPGRIARGQARRK